MPLDFNEYDYGAHFSDCRKYRYALWRIWDKTKPLIMFIGLNPSKANEDSNDPTVKRVINFAKSWGFGGVYMMNCFPFISTDPKKLTDHGNCVENYFRLFQIEKKTTDIIFAWGAFKAVKENGMDIELSAMFPNAKALVINSDGSPRHPLYVKGNVVPVLFTLKK